MKFLHECKLLLTQRSCLPYTDLNNPLIVFVRVSRALRVRPVLDVEFPSDLIRRI
jgi:hypothetical protein